MLKKEIKKSGIHYGGFLAIVILAIILCLFRTENHLAFNQNLEFLKEEYEKIEEQYGLCGMWTQKKQDVLDELVKNCKEKQQIRSKAVTASLQGNISPEEYIQIMQETKSVYDEQRVLEQLQGKFNLAKSNVQKQYIMYDNGWVLFFYQPYGFLLLIVGLIFATIIWLSEFSGKNSFYSFLITTPMGKKKLVHKKLKVMLLFAFFYSLMELGLWGISLHIKYGLSHGNYPVQSIMGMQEVHWNLTLWEAVVVLLILQTFFLYLSMILMSVFILLLRNAELILLSLGLGIFVLGNAFWKENFWCEWMNCISGNVFIILLVVVGIVISQFVLLKLWERNLS